MDQRLTSVALTVSNGFEGCGASGFNVCDDLVMTHGALLNEQFTNTPKLRDFIESMTIGELQSVPLNLRQDLSVRVYQQQPDVNLNDRNIMDEDKKISAKNSTSYFEESIENSTRELKEVEGTIIVAWKCPLLENTFRELLNSWSFDKSRKNVRSLLSIFMIVQLNRRNGKKKYSLEKEVSRVRRVLKRFIENIVDHPLINPPRGTGVEIFSTPFGNPVFIDSLSHGVISNVFGDDGCVMLTDANAVPGSEGAPVYVTRTEGMKSYICGMVIAPLSWCRGEWVDYTFAASLLPCLRSLLRSKSLNQHCEDDTKSRIAESLDQSLVLVRCGSAWGTGIIFDAGTGTIITCSHVVQKAPESRIKVVLRRGVDSVSSGSPWAKLVYRTVEGEPYDVAVLKLDPREIEPMLRSIKIASHRPALRGELVASAGFPFFSSRFPTITRGNVSGINECMLRTTCCVQSGSSGGPIVRWSNGEMLGMVVCNAIAKNETKLYPRLNMAVPVSILEPPISEYLRTGEVKALDGLRCKDLSVKRTWNFHRLPSSKI